MRRRKIRRERTLAGRLVLRCDLLYVIDGL
jgi:hypothetical protein